MVVKFDNLETLTFCPHLSHYKKNLFSELVFNNSFTCVYEILTDPSYIGQSILFNYPLIGSYDPKDSYYESIKPTVDAILVEEIDFNSSFAKWLIKNDVLIISGLDTRNLTLKIRNAKSSTISIDNQKPKDFSTKDMVLKYLSMNTYKTTKTHKLSKFDLLIIDCGMKKSIFEYLKNKGLSTLVIPYIGIDIEKVCEENKINSILISNGPGDPRDINDLIVKVKRVIGKFNVFGVCLGHQIISLALGFKVEKMEFGHHGSNHGVLHLHSNKAIITSQNHNYSVSQNSKIKDVEISYVNTLDGTVEGICSKKKKIESVQFHPEASPGPHDGYCILDNWVKIIKS